MERRLESWVLGMLDAVLGKTEGLEAEIRAAKSKVVTNQVRWLGPKPGPKRKKT